jgi:hypothetical protein
MASRACRQRSRRCSRSDFRVSERFLIRNTNKAAVPTTPFVDRAYAGVSAVFRCSIDRRADAHLPTHVAHNPVARVGIAPGCLGATVEEWIAEPAARLLT